MKINKNHEQREDAEQKQGEKNQEEKTATAKKLTGKFRRVVNTLQMK